MLAQCFADVILPLANDESLVLRALERHCPHAWEWCKKVAVCPRTLALAVVEALPAALDVGLREKIASAWWPKQQGRGPWPAEFDLETAAALEHLDDGLMVMGLRLRARLHLSQPEAEVFLSDRAPNASSRRGLLLGEPRSWAANWTLSLTDGPSRQSPQEPQSFCHGQASVHLMPAQIVLDD